MTHSNLPEGKVTHVSVSSTGLVNIIFPTQTVFLDERESEEFLDAVFICQKDETIRWADALLRVARACHQDPDAD